VSVKIGLISDVHATPAPLYEALELFRREGVAAVLCAGDVAGYGNELEATARLLIESGCQVVLGNHDLWQLQRSDCGLDQATSAWLGSLPAQLEFTVAGLQISMVHASPPDSLLEGIRLLDEEGRLLAAEQARWSESLCDVPADVLVVGHTHQVFAERLGRVLVVNPGSTRFNHSCAILQLPQLVVTFHPLAGRSQPLLSWNWGLEGLAEC
jgi:putative phosphoesterase